MLVGESLPGGHLAGRLVDGLSFWMATPGIAAFSIDPSPMRSQGAT